MKSHLPTNFPASSDADETPPVAKSPDEEIPACVVAHSDSAGGLPLNAKRVKTTPLLMTGGNVRLIQQDLKTNTRRVVTFPSRHEGFLPQRVLYRSVDKRFIIDEGRRHFGQVSPFVEMMCPYGNEGDQLAIRETFWCWGRWNMGVDESTGKVTAEWINLTDAAHPIVYDADKPQLTKIERHLVGYHKRPSIYLPKDAWRIHLEITRIEVERLHDISAADAVAEGMEREGAGWKSYETILEGPHKGQKHPHSVVPNKSPITSYRELWESINGKQRPDKPDISWKANPFVWSIHFKKLS